MTWLVNFEMGGMVPASFNTAMLNGLMVYPKLVVNGMELRSSSSSSSSDDNDDEDKLQRALQQLARSEALVEELKLLAEERRLELERQEEELVALRGTVRRRKGAGRGVEDWKEE